MKSKQEEFCQITDTEDLYYFVFSIKNTFSNALHVITRQSMTVVIQLKESNEEEIISNNEEEIIHIT